LISGISVIHGTPGQVSGKVFSVVKDLLANLSRLAGIAICYLPIAGPLGPPKKTNRRKGSQPVAPIRFLLAALKVPKIRRETLGRFYVLAILSRVAPG
jgi:hypothetical protein